MKKSQSGFTLIQISILLTVSALVLVTVLPSKQSSVSMNAASAKRLNNLFTSFRSYMVANGGQLPCPADASLPTGSSNYGVAAGGSGPANNCTGSTPAANYVDASNKVAIGAVPVKTLGLPNEAAFDEWGRNITYAVDTNVTGTCWASPETGTITVTDNGTANKTIMVLVSHGFNGHGAFIPLPKASGTAVRLNNNSSSSNELLNAHLDSSFNPTTPLTNFVNTVPSLTFDDILVYSNSQFNMSARPLQAASTGGISISSVSAPASSYYYTGATITFSVTFSGVATVTGSPRLAISENTVGGGAVSLAGSSTGAGYATYLNGSGTATLNFSYTIVAGDMAPNGFTVSSPLDLNGGTIATLCSPAFTTLAASGVVIPKVIALTSSSGTSWTVPVDFNTSMNKIEAVGAGGKGSTGSITKSGAGGGGGAYALLTNYTPSSPVTIKVGAGSSAAATTFGSASILSAAAGANAATTTGGAGGAASSCVPTSGAYSGGSGGGGRYVGNNGGGAGGGGGAAGPTGAGMAGGSGGSGSFGGGGGGGGANGGSATPGGGGATGSGSYGAGGIGGSNNAGLPGSTGLTCGAAVGSPTAAGAGGGGAAGCSDGTTNGAAGGVGSAALTWITNPTPANYGPGGGGGGSGGIHFTNNGNGGAGSGYGSGGGGAGSNDEVPTGALGAGAGGLLMITYR